MNYNKWIFGLLLFLIVVSSANLLITSKQVSLPFQVAQLSADLDQGQMKIAEQMEKTPEVAMPVETVKHEKYSKFSAARIKFDFPDTWNVASQHFVYATGLDTVQLRALPFYDCRECGGPLDSDDIVISVMEWDAQTLKWDQENENALAIRSTDQRIKYFENMGGCLYTQRQKNSQWNSYYTQASIET